MGKFIPILLVLAVLGGFGYYNSIQESGPTLASEAAPFPPTEPTILSTGETVDVWRVAPTTAQIAALIEEAQPVVVDRVTASDWSPVEGSDDVIRADLSAEFTRRDEDGTGRWEFTTTYEWDGATWISQ